MAKFNEYYGYIKLPGKKLYKHSVRLNFNGNMEKGPEGAKLRGFSLRMFVSGEMGKRPQPEISVTLTPEQWLDLIDAMKAEYKKGNCSRESQIYRYDGKNQHLVPITSQCAENYFYSREKAQETENFFQRGENLYCQCIDKIRSGTPLTLQNGGNLLLMMFDFYLRNAAHRNLTGKEGIDAYNLRSRIFMGKILPHREDDRTTSAEIVAHINENWGVYIVAATSSIFITSDHPSIFTVLNPSRRNIEIVTLPLTPHYMAVGFDKRFVQIISDVANHEDERTLNAGQLSNAKQCIYSSHPIPNEHIATINQHFSNKKNDAPSEVFENEWKMAAGHLPKEYYFSFMRLIPPLF
jgi:hypothetical protein